MKQQHWQQSNALMLLLLQAAALRTCVLLELATAVCNPQQLQTESIPKTQY
jgi:hypothetical protein